MRRRVRLSGAMDAYGIGQTGNLDGHPRVSPKQSERVVSARADTG